MINTGNICVRVRNIVIIISVQFENTMPSPNGFQRREAEDHEIQTFRHVTDRLSSRVWLALFIGSMERFAFYAVTAPWRECAIAKCNSLLTIL